MKFVGYIPEAQFTTPPLQKFFRLFSFVSTQPVDMIDRLSKSSKSKAEI